MIVSVTPPRSFHKNLIANVLTIKPGWTKVGIHYALRQNKTEKKSGKGWRPGWPGELQRVAQTTSDRQPIHIYVRSVSKLLQLQIESDYSNPQLTTVATDVGAELQSWTGTWNCVPTKCRAQGRNTHTNITWIMGTRAHEGQVAAWLNH